MGKLVNIIKDLFTEANGLYVDLKRVAGAAGVTTFNYLEFHAVVINKESFNASDFGIGLAAVIGALGAVTVLGHKVEAADAPPTENTDAK